MLVSTFFRKLAKVEGGMLIENVHLCYTVKKIAVQHGMIVIASIHQPNWDTFALFDKLLLLSQGHTMYFGPTGERRLKIARRYH